MPDESRHFVSSLFEIVKDMPGRFKKPTTLSNRFDLGGSMDGEWIRTDVDDLGTFAVLAIDPVNSERETPNKCKPVFSDIAGHWGCKFFCF